MTKNRVAACPQRHRNLKKSTRIQNFSWYFLKYPFLRPFNQAYGVALISGIPPDYLSPFLNYSGRESIKLVINRPFLDLSNRLILKRNLPRRFWGRRDQPEVFRNRWPSFRPCRCRCRARSRRCPSATKPRRRLRRWSSRRRRSSPGTEATRWRHSVEQHLQRLMKSNGTKKQTPKSP